MDFDYRFFMDDRGGFVGPQPTKEELNLIAEKGCSSVVNLAEYNSDIAIPEEGGIVVSLGMSYFHTPVPFNRPKPDHFKKFFKLMQILQKEKVLVHCNYGFCSSAFVHKYLTLLSPHRPVTKPPILETFTEKSFEKEDWQSILNLTPKDVGL